MTPSRLLIFEHPRFLNDAREPFLPIDTYLLYDLSTGMNPAHLKNMPDNFRQDGWSAAQPIDLGVSRTLHLHMNLTSCRLAHYAGWLS
ncbi:hypothetical protein SAMN05216420_104168 [Nitrosospira sp. Nl5]|nr:hypothetical protein SAMN05216420_104168 [Nitrosospira sp. Nl5]